MVTSEAHSTTSSIASPLPPQLSNEAVVSLPFFAGLGAWFKKNRLAASTVFSPSAIFQEQGRLSQDTLQRCSVLEHQARAAFEKTTLSSATHASSSQQASAELLEQALSEADSLQRFWEVLCQFWRLPAPNSAQSQLPLFLTWVNPATQRLELLQQTTQEGQFGFCASHNPLEPTYSVPLTHSQHPLVQAFRLRTLSFAPCQRWREADCTLNAWLKELGCRAREQERPVLEGFYTLPLIAGNKTHALLSVGVSGLAALYQPQLTCLLQHKALLAQTFWNLQLREQSPLLSDWKQTLPLLEPLMTALKLKDPYTHMHSQQVARLAEELSCYMGLDPWDAQALRLGALLHDIGKLAIADSILNKPSSLNQEEWVIMRQHAEWGAQHVLASVEPLRPVLPSIRYHHERWSGGGYPHGLKGTAIPFGARVIAVVDAYHAMTSDRPYRSAMPAERAFGLLKQDAGKQFDPMVVEAFLESAQRGTFPTLTPLLSD